MRLRPAFLIAALFGMLPAFPALAQEQAEACRHEAQQLPPEFAGWASRKPIDAAKTSAGAKRARIEVGQAIDAKLQPTLAVEYPVHPGQKGGSVSYGGLFSLTVKDSGTYRIALGAGAWIDVVRSGEAVESTAHGHGPDCSGIRKIVDFPLSAGTYLLQIGANGGADLPILVVRRL